MLSHEELVKAMLANPAVKETYVSSRSMNRPCGNACRCGKGTGNRPWRWPSDDFRLATTAAKPETLAALRNMVTAARRVRKTLHV